MMEISYCLYHLSTNRLEKIKGRAATKQEHACKHGAQGTDRECYSPRLAYRLGLFKNDPGPALKFKLKKLTLNRLRTLF